MKDKTRRNLLKFWRGWVKPFLVVFVVLSTFRSAVADWNDVPTGSMKPTILEGDRIFVNKLAYDLKVPFTTWHVAEWADPQRGDVVILFAPDTGDRLVKRVVGLPGDTIEVRDHRLFVNGQPTAHQPLDPAIARQVDAEPRSALSFARESVGEASYPVMIMPGVSTLRSFDKVTVPPGHYFVMGDNRDNSRDSRFFGSADRRLIVGKVVGLALSVDPDHYYLPRWHRFFSSLP